MVWPWTKHQSVIGLPGVQEKSQEHAHMQSHLDELRTQDVRDGVLQTPSSWVIGLSLCCLFDEAVTNSNIQRRVIKDSE